MSAEQGNPGATVSGVVAIIRLRESEPDDAIATALLDGGVHVMEVTLPTPGSLGAIRRWSTHGDLLVGAGTVRTVADADAAIAAGARFLVTPTTVPDVLAAARAAGVPVVCGALTPTEIDLAWHRGATAVKVFPVSAVGGAGYLRAVREPLGDVPLLPTGGVSLADLASYARMGCAGAGVGGALVSADLVASRRWAALTERAGAFTAAWNEGRVRRDA
ncbi:2-dehydro-3-deoxy-phosphogluconate aldolase [Sphaerisporangium siamense]|uniref:2-dehydro-3-deoxyphosphogluconate aldolase/(4S)-4-hydroxy-2-oxoglutarate aldolase n=1 Tax=Sphaerisporangium siamense TaxID=795645 RepID=A0A7W7DC75_9ACTN|nr:bifunctional 4-hydroxy-2-oxoglutarate aldolase/2-dehydro-3-deoxy-phosphogluconate aldolase [Sphaerisporangium siamense]MBB4704158.1 2-dehydro-3-deoxyphosphogluconate aldolase/(4S)-4-hydroxy-2-oxoglutarate aldolase [Sphaerisporangium siamense]GII85161.1 2-dehydro-3-deoxy-phosphogluconate aldolase [Sphaerisporangium siamense]